MQLAVRQTCYPYGRILQHLVQSATRTVAGGLVEPLSQNTVPLLGGQPLLRYAQYHARIDESSQR
jgi:hypothetical protein